MPRVAFVKVVTGAEAILVFFFFCKISFLGCADQLLFPRCGQAAVNKFGLDPARAGGSQNTWIANRGDDDD